MGGVKAVSPRSKHIRETLWGKRHSPSLHKTLAKEIMGGLQNGGFFCRRIL